MVKGSTSINGIKQYRKEKPKSSRLTELLPHLLSRKMYGNKKATPSSFMHSMYGHCTSHIFAVTWYKLQEVQHLIEGCLLSRRGQQDPEKVWQLKQSE